jgi:hypothetical protein
VRDAYIRWMTLMMHRFRQLHSFHFGLGCCWPHILFAI